jgi:Na+/H+ antiporter NhaB
LIADEADEKEMAKWVRDVGKVVVYMAFPLTLVLAVILYLVLQYLIDRKDPKLAVAPVNAKYDLVRFE